MLPTASASYIVALKGKEFNVKQKEAILGYVKRLLFEKGPIKISEALEKESWRYEDYESAMVDAEKRGLKIYSGRVDYECSEDNLAEIYEDLFDILSHNSDGNFEVINGDLSY